MKQSTSPPINGKGSPALPCSKSSLRRTILRVCIVLLILTTGFALTLFRIYRADTRHESRGSIWWLERGRNLIPSAAIDITLQRDLLDHRAVYTISEKNLNAFLSERFAGDRTLLDSSSEGSRLPSEETRNAVDRLGWVVAKDEVVYRYAASNGGVHSYYHNPTTGLTYQSSGYW